MKFSRRTHYLLCRLIKYECVDSHASVISVFDTNVCVNSRGQGKSRDVSLVRNQGCTSQHVTAVTVADF